MGSKTTNQIMQYLQEVQSGDESEYLEFCPTSEILPKKRCDGLKRGRRNALEDKIQTRKYHELSAKDTHEIGNVRIETYPVDHSLPGATAYIIEARDGTIGYTGDLRFHGYCGGLIERFVKGLAKRLRVLLEDVKGLAIIDYSKRDSSRITTISNTSSKAGRTFLILPKQA